MAESTVTPAAPAPEPAADATFDSKLAKLLGTGDPEPSPPAADKEAPPVTSETAPDELAPDDLPDEQPTDADADSWLEIERKGEKRRLTKEQAKQYAQLGLDASTLYEQTKGERAAIAAERAALQQKAQVTPQLIDAAANVRMYQQALQRYQNVDWGTLARENPTEYLPERAQFEQLRDGFNTAVGHLNQTSNALQQVDAQVNAAEVQRQLYAVAEGAPELRDPQKFTAETGRMRAYLTEMGITEAEAQQLTDARHFLIVRDAMRYRQAVKAKAERATQSPSLRPGAAPERVNAKERERETVRQLHQAKTLTQKKSLFDKALADKLSRLA